MAILRRMWRLVAIVTVFACGISEPETETLATNVELDNSTVFQNATIHVTITSSNYGSQPVTLSAPGGCYLFFQVRAPAGGAVYVSNTLCGGAATTKVLQPGEEEREVYEWDGRSATGTRLASGTYELRVGAMLPGKSLLGAATVIEVE